MLYQQCNTKRKSGQHQIDSNAQGLRQFTQHYKVIFGCPIYQSIKAVRQSRKWCFFQGFDNLRKKNIRQRQEKNSNAKTLQCFQIIKFQGVWLIKTEGSELNFGRQGLGTGSWPEKGQPTKGRKGSERESELQTAALCVRKLNTMKCWEPKQDWFLLTRKLLHSYNSQLQLNMETSPICFWTYGVVSASRRPQPHFLSQFLEINFKPNKLCFPPHVRMKSSGQRMNCAVFFSQIILE